MLDIGKHHVWRTAKLRTQFDAFQITLKKKSVQKPKTSQSALFLMLGLMFSSMLFIAALLLVQNKNENPLGLVQFLFPFCFCTFQIQGKRKGSLFQFGCACFSICFTLFGIIRTTILIFIWLGKHKDRGYNFPNPFNLLKFSQQLQSHSPICGQSWDQNGQVTPNSNQSACVVPQEGAFK